MSRRQLGKHHALKGAVTSPARRAILQHLQMHGECTTGELRASFAHFATWRITADGELPANTNWLDSHLRHLRAAGHISQHINDSRQLVWKIAATGDSKPAPEELPEVEAHVPGEVAAPRQTNLMHGPVYVPAASTPARSGAMDFSRHPSLMGTRRVSYRSRA